MNIYENIISNVLSSNNHCEFEPIMEAYYGKLPEFELAEKHLSSIINRVRKEKNKANPNKYKENEDFCKLISKVFGFKKTYVYWIPSSAPNAFTVNVQAMLSFGEAKDFVEKRSDRGFYDNSHKSVLTVYIYTGMLDKINDITSRELLAIILHEIGHNFDFSLYHTVMFIITTILSLGMNLLYIHNTDIETHNQIKSNYMDKVKKESEVLYKDQKKRDKYNEDYKKAMEKYIKSGYFKGIVKFLTTNIFNILFLPVAIPMQILNIDGHKGEQFADSFATAYGYGTELISALDKISGGTVEKRTKGLQILEDLNRASYELMINVIGEVHGTNQERCKECIKKIRADIKSGDYPEGMKEELYHEVNKLEDIYRTIITSTPDDKYKITKACRRICNFIFGGAANVTKIFKPNKV